MDPFDSSKSLVQAETNPGWLQLVFFHFGTENREEQLKKAPCSFKTSVKLQLLISAVLGLMAE